jgi:hypothetical protein
MRRKDLETLGIIALLAIIPTSVVVVFSAMLFLAMESMK